MGDMLTSERRSWNMSRIRSRDTQPEIRLRSLLHLAGFRFRLHKKGLPGRPDIVMTKHRTVIFVHGCFWHRHSACKNATTPSTRREFWENKFTANVSRDARNRTELEAAGWRVLIVWECELAADADRVVRNISNRLRMLD